MEPLAAAIGARVRQQRLARGWTLDALAAAAGLSRRMVVNVEQGEANPSVGTLLKLGDALGIGLPVLVEPPRSDRVAVTRDGEGSTLWTGEHGGHGVLLSAVSTPDVVELWSWLLGAGDAHASDPHTPGTTELLHVLAGSVRVRVDGDAQVLVAGDAASFPGDVPHAYENAGTTPARFVLTVFEPRS